jgi:hypothetical protein
VSFDYYERLFPWADPLSEAIATADPSSTFFSEITSLAIRAELDRPNPSVASADVAAVMDELGVSVHELANKLEVPLPYIWAIHRGWHRLGMRGLALVAEALEVPIGRFFHDGTVWRLDSRRYFVYRTIAPQVTILGGEP